MDAARTRRRRVWAGALVVLLGVAPEARAAGTLAVTVTVTERLGVARSGELVTGGVALPREAGILDTGGLALLDEATGEAVDAGFAVISRWGGTPDDTTRPIQWVLLSFSCDVAAGASRRFVLTDLRPPPPLRRIVLSRGPESWTVDTGPGGAVFEVPVTAARLLASVRLEDGSGDASGQDLLAGSGEDGPYLTDGGRTDRAASAAGGCRVEVFLEDPQGQRLTLVVRGAYRSYAPGDPELSADDDLDFATTLTFWAGSRSVLIRHTVQNNRDWVPLENNADFRTIQSGHHVSFEEEGIRLAVSPAAAESWRVLLGPDGPEFTGAVGDEVGVYQDNTGDDGWDLWRNRRTEGNDGNEPVPDPVYGPQAYVRTDLRGVRVTAGGVGLFSGSSSEDSKMRGFVAVEGPAGGAAAAIRHVWQRYPKALRVGADGALELAFLPAEFRARHVLRVGEQTTEEALLVFFGPGEAQAARAAALAFQDPLVPVVDPAWACEISRVLPLVSAGADPAHRFAPIAGVPELAIPDVTPAAYDACLARHLTGPGEPGLTFDGLAEAVSASQMYSWLDWGDLPIDFEQEEGCGAAYRSITGQYGWKYDGDWGLLAAFLRTGDRRFLDWGLAAAAHTTDIDTLHHGRQSGRGIASFLDGGAFGHSQHDNDGDMNPHRNGVPGLCPGGSPPAGNWNGTPTPDVAFGGEALALAWELTGQYRYREALLDLADWMAFYVETYGVDPGNGRAVANALNVLSAALDATGDGRYRRAADLLVAGTPGLAGPMPPGWFGGWFARALGRYAWVLRQWDERSVDDELAALAETPQTVEMDPGTGSYGGDVDFYAGDLCRADAYAWGALLLGRGRGEMLDRARDAFATGMLFPFCAGCLYGHAKVWQAKEWVLALACGHVYELAVYDETGGPRWTPGPPTVTPVGFPAGQNTPPAARIAGPAELTVLEERAVSFDGSASTDAETPAGGLTFRWDFGDGDTASGMRAEHTWYEPGHRTVSLWVSDGEGTGRATVSVTVLPLAEDTTPPGAVLVAPGAGAILSGRVTVTASVTDDTGLGSAVLLLDGSPTGVRAELSGTEAQVAFELDTAQVPDASHTLSVRVWDAAGNVADAPAVPVELANGVQAAPPRRGLRLGSCATCETAGVTMLELDAADPEQAGTGGESFELGRAGGGLWVLLRWDLSVLDPGTRVVAARVGVHYTGGEQPGWPWAEAMVVRAVEDPDHLGAWDPAAVSFARRAPGVPWTASGGTLADALGEALVQRWYGPYNEEEPARSHEDVWELPPALVQAWLDDPGANQGLALRGVDLEYGAAGTLAGPEHADTALRPYLELEIEATPDGEPPQVEGVRVTHDGAGRTVVTWHEIQEEGVRYRIYRHSVPITPATLGLAERVAEVRGNGSALAPIRTMAEGFVLPPAAVDVPYEARFTVSGSSTITGWTASNLPAGLTMDADGLLHGTPQEEGSRVIRVVPVRDDPAAPEALAFSATLRVLAAPGPSPEPSALTLQPVPFLDDVVTMPSGSAEHRWAVREGEGELPPGTGVWVGSPDTAGMAYYAVTSVVYGRENRTEIGAANAPPDPVEEVVGDGLPVLQAGPLDEPPSTGSMASWIWAFWPGHGRFGNDPSFPGIFRVAAPAPLDPTTAKPVHVTFGGYGSTYMMPPYSTVEGAVVVVPESRTPAWTRFGGHTEPWADGHTLSDWFVGYVDTLGRIDARPADGTFHYYGVERTRFVVDWLTRGPGHEIYGTDPARVVAWGGSQGGTGVLFSVLEDPGLFAAAQANVPCLDWYTEDHINIWTSNTFEYLAGRPSDHVLDVHGDPTVDALDAPTRLERLAASPELADFPQLVVLSGWNDPVLYWDGDDPEMARAAASSGLPVTFVWHDGGHWTNTPAPFLADARFDRAVVGVADCTLVSEPVPPDDAEDWAGSGSVPWPPTGSINGDPLGFENGAYPSHIRIGTATLEETGALLRFTVAAAPGEGGGTADLRPLRMRRFHPEAGSVVDWQVTGPSGDLLDHGSEAVAAGGGFVLHGIPFDEAGVTVTIRTDQSACNPDALDGLDAADLAELLRSLADPALTPPGPADCSPDGALTGADLDAALAAIFSAPGARLEARPRSLP